MSSTNQKEDSPTKLLQKTICIVNMLQHDNNGNKYAHAHSDHYIKIYRAHTFIFVIIIILHQSKGCMRRRTLQYNELILLIKMNFDKKNLHNTLRKTNESRIYSMNVMNENCDCRHIMPLLSTMCHVPCIFYLVS